MSTFMFLFNDCLEMGLLMPLGTKFTLGLKITFAARIPRVCLWSLGHIVEQNWTSSSLDLMGIPDMSLKNLRAIEYPFTGVTIVLCSEMNSKDMLVEVSLVLGDVITVNITFDINEIVTMVGDWLLMLLLNVLCQARL